MAEPTKVTNQTEFSDAVSNNLSPIIISGNITLTSVTYIEYPLTIQGEPGASLLWGGTEEAEDHIMIQVNASGQLVLDSITLDGGGLNVTLIQVNDGSLTTNGDTVLKNTLSTTACNAVKMNHGTFVMNDGLITQINTNESVYCNGGAITMNNHAKISDNRAAGVTMEQASLLMSGQSKIANNQTKHAGGGLCCQNCTVTLKDNSQISDNISDDTGAGAYLQSGTVLQLLGNSAISNNSGGNGAGLFLNDSTALIGLGESSPSISNNVSTGQGGGIFIDSTSTVNLSGTAALSGNTAVKGKGIYNKGVLNLSKSPQISDGLFFDDLENGGLPVIVDALSDNAQIQLEASPYVSPENVPFAGSKKGADYPQISVTDCLAWKIPPEFGLGYIPVLNASMDQVMIDLEAYQMVYKDLFDAKNPNPDSYRISNLPMILNEPGERPNYTFTGWYNNEGRLVTEMPVSTTGNITLTAAWKRNLYLLFDENAAGVSDMPDTIPVQAGEMVRVPSLTPHQSGYRFICWNISASGNGRLYAPDETVKITDSSVILYAQWAPLPGLRNICDKLKTLF